MALAGLISLWATFIALLASIALFIIGSFITSTAKQSSKDEKKRYEVLASRVNLAAHIGVLATAFALTIACAILIYCFVTGDPSIEYVVKYHSNSSSSLALLYKIAGLWGGREGSLLFWAWLISLFAAAVALKGIRKRDPLDNMALLIIQIVLLAFVFVLLFSQTNMPFIPIDPGYLDAQGRLKDFATLMREYATGAEGAVEPSMAIGMSVLLEHWAMAIHPPTLFIGYAGLTVPFAYAIATLIVKDSSKRWVERATRYTLFSWVFLGIGIGLGAIWAYVVLGWGGYWGWDPVENASLLSWILSVALIHSFTVYRQRGAFKRWSVMCACLAFAFVIVGTFITRSGIVQNSVHAFGGDLVSLILFLVLILASVLAGIIGLAVRWKTFGAVDDVEELSDSLMSKAVAYFFNNVFLVVSAFCILLLTLSSALPTWVPFIGGMAADATMYNAIARPMGILYCLIMAVCPLLGWAKTDVHSFLKRARIPALCALVVFALLAVYFFTYLLPSYDAMIASGGSRAEIMRDAGPAPLYFALTLFGFLVAALLFFNALFMLGKVIGAQAKASKTNPLVACFVALRNQPSRFGGFLAHLAMAIILVGLIGSSMYVTETSHYVAYDEATDTASEDFTIQDYTLVFVESAIEEQENGQDAIYSVTFDVYQSERYLGRLQPGIYFVTPTQQRNPQAAVLMQPMRDLFVIYNGVASDGSISLTAMVNPCILFVWVGFGLLMVGTIIATVGRRTPLAKREKTAADGDGDAGADPASMVPKDDAAEGDGSPA